jgi:hypothetical protein
VAMLARQDGGKPRLSNERYRVRETCRAAEERYGLRRTAPGDRTAAPRPTRAEHEKTRRRSWDEAPRVTLKRAVSTAAAGASTEQEFFTRLDHAGILVRQRFSTRNPGEVTGYSVALPGETTRAGTPVWFGGGKLAPDLTLPKLPLGTRPHCTRRAVHPGRTQRHLGARRLGRCRHLACRRVRAAQPGAASGRRFVRPRCPCSLWPHPASDPGREQPAPRGPAAVHCRVCQQRPCPCADHAGHAPCRACGGHCRPA